jgi:hypothetical protein
MNESVLAHFEALLSVESIKLNDLTSRELHKTTASLSSRGILISSAAFRALTDTTVRTIPLFSQTAFNILSRVMEAHSIAINEASRREVEDILSDAIGYEVETLVGLVADQPPFKSKPFGDIADNSLDEIRTVGAREIKRINSEIALIAIANDRRSREAGVGHTTVFNGPIGVVQTGPGSFGAAIQHIDSGTREHLAAALEKVIAALDASEDELPFDKSEVRELVVDGQAELKKDKPNFTRLKSIVSGVGTAINYAPKLKDAYDAVKWAAGFLCVVLPG